MAAWRHHSKNQAKKAGQKKCGRKRRAGDPTPSQRELFLNTL
jgi:hypothetical protein